MRLSSQYMRVPLSVEEHFGDGFCQMISTKIGINRGFSSLVWKEAKGWYDNPLYFYG